MVKRFGGAVLGAAFVVAGVLVLPGASSAKQDKVDVCHDGDDGWELISIASPAVDAHIAHGDAFPGDPVPGMDGVAFGNDCTPAEPEEPGAMEGCFLTAADYFTPTDGTNPQLLTGVGAYLYDDADCVEYVAIWGAENWVAWVWDGDETSALAACEALGGTDVSMQPQPNLWLCYTPLQ